MPDKITAEPSAAVPAARDQITAEPAAAVPHVRLTARQRITLLGLIAATYFMVAGGPYGLENVIQGAGYLWAVIFLAVIPFVWSLPTALMVSELSSAMPDEGGFYIWVRRGLGPFWGFQEAWLSLAASIFDMAIYPILFVTYLGFLGEHVLMACQQQGLLGGAAFNGEDLRGTPRVLIAAGMIVVSAAANLLTPRSLGRWSFLLTFVMLSPFALLTVWECVHPVVPAANWEHPAKWDVVGALLFALWNYMGWDNATTIAGEVDRPQRTYPLAMACAVLLVTLTYLFPVLAASYTGMSPGEWETGAWVTVGMRIGGVYLAIAIGLGGLISQFGMFNSLVMSYTRLPVVLAEDGYLPACFTRRLRTGAPWVAILVMAVCWGLATQLGLMRVLALDIILYGLSLLLEFAALVVLRIREPNLPRPFRVPGGLGGAVLLGVFPALLIGVAIVDQSSKWTKDTAVAKSAEEGDSGEEKPQSKKAAEDDTDNKNVEERASEKGEPEPKKATRDVADDDMFCPGVGVLIGAGLVALGPLLYCASRFLTRKPLEPPIPNAAG